MSSSYQSGNYKRPEEQESDVNIAELVGTAALAGVGLGGIAGLALKRRGNTAKATQEINEFIGKAKQQRKTPGATSGVRQADLSNVDVAPSKTPTRMKEVYQEVSQPVEINKTPQLTGATKVSRPNTFVDDYTREITEQRIGEQQLDDALQVLNLTPESRSERARQAANVRRVQAAAADDIIDQLRRERTVDQTATAINSGAGQETANVMSRLQSNEDLNLSAINNAKNKADALIQQEVKNNNIPLDRTPNRDAGINLVSSELSDGRPVDQRQIPTGQVSVKVKQDLENAGLPSGSSSASDLSITNVAAEPVTAQQFVSKQLSLFDPRPQSFELQDAVTNFDSKVQQLMTGGGMSRARAEKTILGDGKITTSQGRELREQLLQDLEQTTGLNPEDASNIAGSVINPITGQREVSSVQKVGAGYSVKSYVRKPFEQRSIPNVDPETNEALIKSPAGKSIKGRAPSYYEVPPKEQVRELPGPFKEEVPDRRTATRGGFGAALQKAIEEEGTTPAKMPEGGFAGIGIYGEDLKYVPGPAGVQAGKKPTDLPVSKNTGKEFNPLTQRERSGLKNLSNNALQTVVARGTYQSGKLSTPAKAAQVELNIRRNYTSDDFDPKKVSPETVKTSLEASEEMRRARIEGRNPQEALKTFMQNKGLM